MFKKLLALMLPIGSVLLSFTIMTDANAVPSYARQTGMGCSACHTAFPQLTTFGRQFKLHGYTATNQATVKGDGVNIDLDAPLSVMLQTTLSQVKKAPDADTDKSKLQMPAQLSVFYAGRISDKIGSFIQLTSEQGGSFEVDNTDIRYADDGKVGDNTVTYGVSLNNNPTVQDPWNSTPTWGFPWFEAGYGYEFPDTLITSVGGSVTGLTGYGFVNEHIYAEMGSYAASNTDGVKADKVINGNAPYWRLAYASDSNNDELNWEVGTFGMKGKLNSDDQLTDTGIDGQVQWAIGDQQSLTLDGNYIHESQPNGEHLNTMKADLTWYTNQTWGMTVGYHGVMSSSNAINGTDSANTGKWNLDAYQVQLNYTPWLNTRFALQYTDYAKVNGSTSNASDNNQTMVGAWFLF